MGVVSREPTEMVGDGEHFRREILDVRETLSVQGGYY
jgi:hypothetical protein